MKRSNLAQSNQLKALISALGKTAKSYNVHKIHSLTVRLLQSTFYIVAFDYILCDKDNTFDLTSSKHDQDLYQQYQKNKRQNIGLFYEY